MKIESDNGALSFKGLALIAFQDIKPFNFPSIQKRMLDIKKKKCPLYSAWG